MTASGNTLLLYPPFKLSQAPLGTILRHSSQLSKLGYSRLVAYQVAYLVFLGRHGQ